MYIDVDILLGVLVYRPIPLQAELLELIVCGNIVGLDIPVRVVQHQLWRPHILETTADEYSSDCEAEVSFLESCPCCLYFRVYMVYPCPFSRAFMHDVYSNIVVCEYFPHRHCRQWW